MTSLVELFGSTVARCPDATAIVDENGRCTYVELDRMSRRVARELIEAGVAPGDRVCLLIPKSIESIVAILAVLRVGGVYVPLDPESPAARQAKVVRRADTAWIASGHGGRERAQEIGALLRRRLHVFHVDRTADVGEDGAGLPGVDITGDAPAYVFFTSGSTGEPKGVVVSHRNVLGFLAWAVPYFCIDGDDRVSGHAPLHFDLSVFDVFAALAAGAELHLVPARLNVLPHKLAEWIGASRLTQWFSVPSVMTLLAHFDLVSREAFPDLERVIWCGEVLPTPTLIHWMQALPGVRFTNLYGPTETTIASSYHEVTSIPRTPTEPIPIGRPCDGEELLVLDDEMRPVPPGEMGDLWIRGVGVSSGYWRDALATDAVFLPDAGAHAGSRIYRTGDLASVGQGGEIHFHGRKDSQIKSRGYRIELGEIEAAMFALDAVEQAAVVAVPVEGFEGLAICCAYVPAAGYEVTPTGLRESLSSALPPYMLPRRWRAMERLPANANGKVDRPALRALFQTAASGPDSEAR